MLSCLFLLSQVASPKLFTKEFNPTYPPTQPGVVAAQPTAAASAAGGVSLGGAKIGGAAGGGGATPVKGIPLPLGGGKAGGINVTPQLIQQLLASASKVSGRNYSLIDVTTPTDHTHLSWPPRALW